MKFLRLLTIAAVLCGTTAATAQTYPAKPIRWVVPYSTGGVSDIAARYLAQRFATVLGGSIVVENRTGAGGVIGTEYVARSPADGYTWVWGGTAALATNLAIHKSLPYDPLKDFIPICRIATAPQILVVKPSLKVNSVKDLVALAKTRPLSYASAGNGTGGHISMELLKSVTGAQIERLAYKGTAPAVADMLGGHVQVMFESAGPLIPHIRSGALLALGTTSSRRLAGLPEIPTFMEMGFKDFRVEAWTALLLPANTPEAIVQRVEAACTSILAEPTTQAKLTELGLENYFIGSAEMTTFMREEIKTWARLVGVAKVKPE
jgi:tripartite-type tricarboxylate transporter receptor subunit TctC